MPEKVVFILSTGRTGTKALADGLVGDEVQSQHQPPFSRLLTVASNYYLHGWLPESILKRLVNKTRVPQILQCDCRYYIQVFSLDHLPAKIISQQYPNVYIVHIVRDPRTFVTSYLNWSHTRFKSYVANKFVPGWHPSAYFTGEMSWKQWRSMDEFQKVCWHWVYKNQQLEQMFDGTLNYMRVRFEDLFLGENKQNVLKTMIEFIGMPYQNKFAAVLQHKKNDSRKDYFPPWQEWKSERQRQLLNICGELMIRYGYAIPEKSKELL